jgi:branched-chain amino acid transport system ATP-binding protein
MLEVSNLARSFGGLRAVDGVTLALPEGGITALIGPNGAGKTTLFAMMAGFVRPSAGSVHFGGQDITHHRPDQIARLGLVRTFQITQPFAGLTVAENIRVGAFLREASPAIAMDAARDVGTKLGLGALLDRPASSLTIAGRKRLEVARAVATRPRMLLLDEVMAGLNPTEIQEIVALIRDVHASGVTILLIEHIMAAVIALAPLAHVLAQGRLIASGAPRDLAQNRMVVEAYLGQGAAARMTTHA